MTLPFIALMKADKLSAGLLGLVASASGFDVTIATVLRSFAENCLFAVSVSLMARAVVVASSV